jgi:hypothetical protein
MKTSTVSALSHRSDSSSTERVLELIGQGVDKASKLTRATGLSRARISQLTRRLIQEGQLCKEGRKLRLTLNKNGPESLAAEIAHKVAPVKDPQAQSDSGEAPESVLEGPNVTISRLALFPAKTASGDMLSREHWYAYTSPSTISQETGVPLSSMIRSVAKELTDNALDWCDRHGCPGKVTAHLEGTHTLIVTNAGPGWEPAPKSLLKSSRWREGASPANSGAHSPEAQWGWASSNPLALPPPAAAPSPF